MGQPPLTDAQCREALQALAIHGTNTQAAAALRIPVGTFTSRLAQARVRRISPDAPDDDTPVGLPYEREWKAWQTYIGCLSPRYSGPAKAIARSGRLKIVVVSDIHAPFHDVPALTHIAKAEADADVCVVLGDLGDGYSLSRFVKYETVPYEAELAAITQILERFSETWPLVKLLEGNHDSARLERRLRDQLPPDFVSAILSMTGGTLSPLVAIAKRLPNVELAGLTVGARRVSWMTQIGDAIFCHAEKFSRVPGAALRSIEEWLRDNESHLTLNPWRVVIQAHTHQLAWFPIGADKLLVECGCLCTLPGYALQAKVGGRPQRTGYVTLTQVDGKTDIDSVKVHWLDAMRGSA